MIPDRPYLRLADNQRPLSFARSSLGSRMAAPTPPVRSAPTGHRPGVNKRHGGMEEHPRALLTRFFGRPGLLAHSCRPVRLQCTVSAMRQQFQRPLAMSRPSRVGSV